MEKSCKTCRHNNKPWDSEVCDGCTRADSNYEADLIDRRDAIKAIEQNIYRHTYLDQIIDIVKLLPSADRPTGECRTCGRNADNGGVYEDGRTKCPIQEHYALLLDGYCHLYEPTDDTIQRR